MWVMKKVKGVEKSSMHERLARVIEVVALSAFFQTYALSSYFSLEGTELVGVVVVECKSTAPETAVDICRFVSY